MNKRHPRRTWQRGFTLVEILIAAFILSIVMASILGTFTGVISSAREAETRSELYQTGRALMDLIATDIRGMIPRPPAGGDSPFWGGVETLNGEETSSMSFVTTNALTMGKVRNPFPTEVTYRLRKNPQGPVHVLWRRAQSPVVPPYDQGGADVPVCRDMEQFRLEFLSKGARQKDLVGAYPEAVIVEFVLNMAGHREKFVTMVRPMAMVEEEPAQEPPSPAE